MGGHDSLVAMRVVTLRSAGYNGWAKFALVGADVAAVPGADGLSLIDTCDATRELARIDDVAAAAYRDDKIVTAGRDGTIRVLRRDLGWTEQDAWQLPESLRGATHSFPTRIALSPSGRYLLVHTDDAHLIDLADRSLRRTIELCGPAFGHASFTRGPRGEELLFIAAKSYMAVQLVDCETGKTMQDFEPRDGWDFCHTNFELSPDGTRLFCFGCTWAAPYSARIYDVGPWFGGTAKQGGRFALPIVFQQSEGEMHQLGDVLPMRATPGADGLVFCVTTVDLGNVPPLGSEDDVEWRADDGANEKCLLTQLQALVSAARFAIVIRRIEALTGALVDWFVHADEPTDEANLHVLSDHQVLLANRRIRLVDAARRVVEDLGRIDLEDGARFDSRVSGDLATMVVLAR